MQNHPQLLPITVVILDFKVKIIIRIGRGRTGSFAGPVRPRRGRLRAGAPRCPQASR